VFPAQGVHFPALFRVCVAHGLGLSFKSPLASLISKILSATFVPHSFLFIGELVNILYFLLIGLFKYTKAAQCKNLVRYKNMFAYTHTQQNKRRVIIF
jgi:hypothetical protein